MADASDSKSDVGDYVWVQVPSPAVKIMTQTYIVWVIIFYAEESLDPKAQGLLDINVSSVGSTGKRSTGPFSVFVSPHLLHVTNFVIDTKVEVG